MSACIAITRRTCFTVLAATALQLVAALPFGGPSLADAQTVPILNDVWLWDATADAPRRVTIANGPGRESTSARISADGRWIVFYSDADFLGEGITNGTDEVWLYEIASERLTRVTRASEPSRDSREPAISADGSLIVFESDSDLLAEGLSAGTREIWLYRVASGEFTRVTRTPDAGGVNGAPVISADGSTVAFHSTAVFDTGNRSGSADVWLADVATLELTRVTRSTGGNSTRPDVDGSGATVVFESDGDPLGRGDAAGSQMNIYVYDVAARMTTRITDNVDPSRGSEAPSVSADGARVVFHSDADLLDEGRPDSVDEIWLYDVGSAALSRLTDTWVPARDAGTNPVAHPDAQFPKISADGSTVVFASDADYLDEDVPNGYPHAWILDIEDGDLRRIDTGQGSGSGPAFDRNAERVVLFRTEFDDVRNMRVGVGPAAALAGPPRPDSLSADDIARDLDAFQAELEGRWSYLRATGVDYEAAIARVRELGAAGMDTDAYGIELQRIIAMFVDGHARVGGFSYPAGFLPFFVEYTDGRYLAIRPDRSGFVDAERPFITHIDGRPIGQWVAAAAAHVPAGSAQWSRRNALSLLNRIQFVRAEMGVQQRDSVTVDLASAAGAVRTMIVPVASSGSGGTWRPDRSSGFLDDEEVGYLRLASMNSAAVDEVLTWLPRFRETRGLIVDVRGNTGGSRDALRALFPYLMSETDAPRVVNTARYRLHPSFQAGHLGGSRFMYVESWSGWTAAEREAIARFKETFEPQWMPPDDEFSDWHYLVMSRHLNPDAYYYDRPVIVLLDQNSFSATDIFVSSFKGWRNVTLMGTASGGGSARQVSTRLPVSGMSVNLASMASFQWTGLLHDGNGTQPDVVVHPVPEYYLDGGPDNVLERALARLRQGG